MGIIWISTRVHYQATRCKKSTIFGSAGGVFADVQVATPGSVYRDGMSPAEERDFLERALTGNAPPNLSTSGTLGRLAQLYLEAPDLPGSAERALELLLVALEREGKSSPLYPKLRHFQAMALRAVKDPPKDAPGTNGVAAEADREAWNLSLKTNPRDAIAFASGWGDWAWSRDLFEEAGEAYSNAEQAQRRLLLNETGEATRLEMLDNSRFATRGAYALHRNGKTQAAILLLESTSVFTLNTNQQSGELRRLEKVNPELSKRLLAAMKAQIEIHERFPLDAFGGLSPEEARARTEADAIAREVRLIPGFENFAKIPGWEDVTDASAQSPLVYLVPTDKGTLGLGVFAKEGAARDLASVDIPASTKEILDAFRAFAEGEYGEGGDRRSTLSALLEWVGSRVMVYVKFLLVNRTVGEAPFVLITFGLLCNLPLHLGIIHPDKALTQSLFHPRNVTFSYSGRSLAASRRKSLLENPAPRALVISNPRPIPPTFDTLLLSGFEAQMVSSHFASDVLAERDATTQRVLELLPGATVAHFSCHGTVDPAFKWTGVLLLANTEALNYGQLRMLPELAARLVVLSACSSGTAAMTIEHCLNLPNAFLAAGAAAVLGTFWHTDELASLLLLTRFYELWLNGRLTPAEALGDAQAWLMTTPAEKFKAMLDPKVLDSPAAGALRSASADDRMFADPWFWGGFFLSGA